MPTIYSMMDISRWALNASTSQLDVVSHNVSNVNTEGYSRQEVVQATRNSQWASEGWYGTGVELINVIQQVDKLLYERITDKVTDQYYENSRLTQLTRLEALNNEAGDTGLGQAITDFFNAWQDVSNNPESTAVREVLAETGQNLVDRLQNLMTDINQVSNDLDGYLDEAVEDANSTIKRIAELNEQIMADEASGKTANDLRDERIRQLNHLAELMDINWFETSSGSITVQLASGKTLVQENYPGSSDADLLSFRTVAGYENNQIIWSQTGTVLDATDITGGSIGAYLQVRGETLPTGSSDEDTGDIPQMMSFLNDLAESIIWEVNRLHSQGAGTELTNSVTGTYQSDDTSVAFNDSNNDLAFADKIENGSFELWVYENGTRRSYTINVREGMSMDDLATRINSVINPTEDETENPVAIITDDGELRLYAADGIEFAFGDDTSGVLAALGINTFFSGSTASNIAVNSTVANDVSLIAAGRITDDGEHAVGSNDNALLIADLKDADTMEDGSATFNESVITWAADLGNEIAACETKLSYAETAYGELMDLRDSVSGVNLDEEMVKLIQYQRTYQMAAKLINVADTMLATLLEIKR